MGFRNLARAGDGSGGGAGFTDEDAAESLLTASEAVVGMLMSNGVDGDADLDGTNTANWVVKSGSTYTASRVPYLGNLDVRNTSNLKMAGFHGPYYKGTCTVEEGSIISDDGNDAVGSVAGALRGAQTLPATLAGATGGTGVGSASSASTGAAVPIAGKYSGGTGGTSGTGNAGGGPGAVTAQGVTRGSIHGAGPQLLGVTVTTVATPTVPGGGTGGGAGGGDGVNPGGGGGAPGGALHMGGGRTRNFGRIGCHGGKGGDGAAGIAPTRFGQTAAGWQKVLDVNTGIDAMAAADVIPVSAHFALMGDANGGPLYRNSSSDPTHPSNRGRTVNMGSLYNALVERGITP